MVGEYSSLEDTSVTPRKCLIKWKDACITGLVGLLIGLAVGLFIGNYGKEVIRDGVFLPGISNKIIQDGDPAVSGIIMEAIKSENIREYLRELTELPHLAGTEANYRLAMELRDFWNQEGLDEVYVTPYDVLLSYPNVTDDDVMNRIELINATGGIAYQSPLREATLHPSDNKSGVVPPFNAFSAPGDITAERLVYVNYGRLEDYRWLRNNTSVNVTGAIVIVRYGQIFRGDKVRLAAKYGAIGIILYSDPADVVPNGSTSKVYPDDWWLPPSGVQRGTVGKMSGEPLTRGYPATEMAYRYQQESKEAELPTILVHPVGYGTAEILLRVLSGEDAPPQWKGGLNITYRLGGVLQTDGWKIRMFISTQNYMRRIHNVFGIIKGAIEPDRYVLMGNHRDAWVFGAIDPSSATAVMKEASRVMGNLVKQGRWRPRRSIIFCSWDAEEYGLFGSYEWVEQYVKNLAVRSLAYINIDVAVTGNATFLPIGTPLMHTITFDAAKKVVNPDSPESGEGMLTVYDKWLKRFPASNQSTPLYPMTASESDHAPFIQLAGIPSAMLRFTGDSFPDINPLYHTRYDTFRILDEMIDRGFKTHRVLCQVAAEMARNLADSVRVPFNVSDLSEQLQTRVTKLDTEYGQLLRTHGIHFEWLQEAADNFSSEVIKFQTRVANINMNDPFAIRRINDQLIFLEKAFIDPAGLPGRPLARHVLFSNLDLNAYDGTTFPGLVDTLLKLADASEEEANAHWEVIKQHFSVIVFTIQSAQSTIREVTTFMPDSEETV